MTAADQRGMSRIVRGIGGRLDRSPLLVMLDVDGTLAPIAPTPAAARVPPSTRAIVGRLAGLPDVAIALVSGRSANDAWRIVQVPGVWVVGNHGFELRHPDGEVTPDERVRSFGGVVDAAARALEADLSGVTGALVENKRWTISVHYRLVHDRDVRALVERATEVASRLGLRVLAGKKIVELRPPVDVNKGTACVALAATIGVSAVEGSAFYAGDDRTDEDAFRELRRALPDTVTVRIAAAEERMESEAELTLDGPEELAGLLDWLADRRAGSVSGPAA